MLVCATAESMLGFRTKAKDWDGESTHQILHEKMDGWRLTVVRPFGEKRARMFTRTQEVTNQLQHAWFYDAMGEIPEGSMLEVELVRPGQNASSVASVLAWHKQKGQEGLGALRNVKDCTVYGFCAPWWAGVHSHNWSFYQHEMAFNSLSVPFAAYRSNQIRRATDGTPPREQDKKKRVWRPFTRSELIELMNDRNARKDRHNGTTIEGYVLKDHPLSGWWKFKPGRTLDAVVTGIKPGEGKYLGQCGALAVSLYAACICPAGGPHDKACPVCIPGSDLQEIALVSGMDDLTRSQIDSTDIGRVIEVEYQLVGDGGRLRHPRFLRWREDKLATECTMDQLASKT